jgi:hypothetical protein
MTSQRASEIWRQQQFIGGGRVKLCNINSLNEHIFPLPNVTVIYLWWRSFIHWLMFHTASAYHYALVVPGALIGIATQTVSPHKCDWQV